LCASQLGHGLKARWDGRNREVGVLGDVWIRGDAFFDDRRTAVRGSVGEFDVNAGFGQVYSFAELLWQVDFYQGVRTSELPFRIFEAKINGFFLARSGFGSQRNRRFHQRRAFVAISWFYRGGGPWAFGLFAGRDYRDVVGEKFFDVQVVKDPGWAFQLDFKDTFEKVKRFFPAQVFVRHSFRGLRIGQHGFD
jgi:hypothetical protein